MILMSKYKGQHGGEKKGQKFRAEVSPPFSGNARKKKISQEGFPKDDTTSRCEFARYLHRVTSSSGAHLVSAEVTPVLVTRDQWGAGTDLFWPDQ